MEAMNFLGAQFELWAYKWRKIVFCELCCYSLSVLKEFRPEIQFELPFRVVFVKRCGYLLRNTYVNPPKHVTQTTIVEDGAITTTISSPVTAKEKIKKKNDMKAISMLLMALPNEHLMTFNQYKDAKSLFAAIEARFGGNEATKKTQMTLLKQMYENFSATSTDLPSEWNTHAVVWRNKSDLDTMNIDDLYNNFKIVKQEETGKNITINRSDTASFDKSKVECYNCHKMGHFTRECSRPRIQDSINRYQDSSRRTVNVEETPPKAMVAIDGVGFDWSYMAEDEAPTNMALMAFLDSESLDKLIESQITNNSKKGLGYESYHAVPPPPTWLFSTPKTDLSYFGLEEFKQPQFESYGPKSCEKESKNVSEEIPNEPKEYPDAPLVKNIVLDNKDCSVESPVVVEKKIDVPTIAKVEVVRPKQQEKPVRKIVRLRAVNTARPTAVNTARPSAVNTVRPNSAVGHPQKKDQGYVGSGCSRYMIGNMSYLSEFKEFDEGYVTFGEERKEEELLVKELLKLVFFLASKDETTGIVKKFITKIENLVDKKVKQNGVAERRNRTLIEDARTMLADSKLPTTFWTKAVNTDHLGKFDGKADEGYFVGYSMKSKDFRVYNIRTRRVEENLHIEFLENKPIIAGAELKWLFDIDMLTESMNYVPVIAGTNSDNFADGSLLFDSSLKLSDDAGSPSFGDAKKKHDEMPGLKTIATNDDSKEEYDFTNLESSIPVNPTPTTRTHKDHPLKQMDVNSAFLYERIKEEVCVCQPLWFEDPDHSDKVYKVVKAPYVLHQAPRAWYETLPNYLLGNGFYKGKIDQTLFIKRQKRDVLLVQVYVDDIIFGSTKKELCTEFERLMKDKFQMSFMEELTFFLGLQVKQKEDGIFISQDKYITEFLRKFNFSYVKSTNTLVDTEKTLVKDVDGADVDVHLYKFMIGSLMYLTASRPDIMYAVCVCTRSQVTPKALHLHAVKRSMVGVGEMIQLKLVKTVNGKKQIQALVDKKKVIITKTSVRSDLHLKDAEGTKCLPTAIIFEQLILIGAKTTDWNEFSSTMASAIICLATNQKFNFSKYIFDHMVKNLEDGVKFLMFLIFVQVFLDSQVEGMLKHKEIYVTPSHTKKIFANMKKCGKDFSDEHVTITSNDPLLNDMFDTSIFDDEEVVSKKKVSTAGPVPTAGEVVTTVGVEVSDAAITSQIFMDEITLAKALIDIKTSKPKAKRILMKEPSETPTLTPKDTSQQSSKAKDKGKAKMIEPEKPLKRKELIMIDEKVAKNLEAQMQAELEEEERLARQKEEEDNIDLIESCDNTQAMMDADYDLVTRLQEEERGELSIKEKLRLFVKLMDKRKKHFFQNLKMKRSEASHQLKLKRGIKCCEKAVEGSEKAEEDSSKREASNLEQEDAKRQRIKEENEYAELKRCLEIIPEDDDDVTIEATPLSSKSPTIVDYKIYKEGRKIFFKIIRADARFNKTKPVDDIDNLIFQTLKTMYEHHVEDNTWKYQQGTAKVLN
nr:putative ribonuclease H-like domain-containing protein [Tanacetum cinerariifolium]